MLIAVKRRYALRKKWQIANDFLEKKPPYYRYLIVGGIFLVFYLLWYFILYNPLQNDRSALHNQASEISKQIKKSQTDANTLIADAVKPPDPKLKAKYEELQKQLKDLDAQLQVLNQDMIPPDKMADVLKEILGKETTLRLVQLNSSPSQLLASGVKKNNSTTTDKLYAQGFELVLDGSYFHTIDYLQRIEKLPWRIFWDQLMYKVTKYPDAQITIRVHTLSRQ